MKTGLLICCFGFLLAPSFSSGQNAFHPAAYTYNDAGGAINSNVPLNEINPHAWRHFHRLFPAAAGNEYWIASEEGYRVSFVQNGFQYQAFFDARGGYRYSLHYYAGKEIPRDPGASIAATYPDFRIDVVTEVTDGVKTIYLVKLVNASTVRTLSVVDGQISVIEDLINGGASAEPAAGTPLISKRSDR